MEKICGESHYQCCGGRDWEVGCKPIGQVLDKPDGCLPFRSVLNNAAAVWLLPLFLVKRSVEILWSQSSRVLVFSMENGVYLFIFADAQTRVFVLEAKILNIANKPLIICKLQPCMQLLKLSLPKVPTWIKIVPSPCQILELA